jgi:hypothetical protein
VQRGKPVAELDARMRLAVTEHAPVHLVAAANKKLSALQAAAHCRDESVGCMRTLAKAAGVEVLLVPSLERSATELTLTLMAFDARADAVTRVAHWQDGSEVTQETYAALPNLIAGLFPEPGAPDMDFVAEGTAEPTKAAPARATLQPPAASDVRSPSLLPPLVLAGGGALLVGAAVVTSVMLHSTQKKYDAADIITRSDAEAAEALHSKASTQATVANVCFGLGAVALAASGAWLAYEWFRSPAPAQASTRIAPWVAPRQVGLVIRHEGGLF